jgi:hypothetical protein
VSSWCCYVRGVNNEDIAYFVKSVIFTLHETFENSVRTIERPPFEVQEQGWGEFEIGIKIQFVDSSEKPVELHHKLKLFHDDKGSSQPSKRPLVSEQYDEIVFAHPTVLSIIHILIGKLLQNPHQCPHQRPSSHRSQGQGGGRGREGGGCRGAGTDADTDADTDGGRASGGTAKVEGRNRRGREDATSGIEDF